MSGARAQVMGGGARRLAGLGTLALAALALSAGEAAAQGRRPKKPPPGDDKPKPSSARRIKNPKAIIVLRSGGRQIADAHIKTEHFEKIEYRRGGRGGSDESVRGEEVAEVRYQEPEAPLYHSGVGQVRAGRYQKAVATLTRARDGADKDSWVWFYATFWIAEAHRFGGESAKAVEEADALLKADEKHFLAPAAIYSRGRAQLAAGQHDEALASFQKLSEGFGNVWGARGKLGAGDAALAKGDLDAARAAYNVAESRGADVGDMELSLSAKLGMGRALIKANQPDDAIKVFSDIKTQTNAGPDVAAGAWVSIGDCLVKKAEAAGGARQQDLRKQALIAYQTCVVRYAGTPDAYPQALFKSAELYEKLGLPALAGLQREELRKQCPNSAWTQKLGK